MNQIVLNLLQVYVNLCSGSSRPQPGSRRTSVHFRDLLDVQSKGSWSQLAGVGVELEQARPPPPGPAFQFNPNEAARAAHFGALEIEPVCVQGGREHLRSMASTQCRLPAAAPQQPEGCPPDCTQRPRRGSAGFCAAWHGSASAHPIPAGARAAS